MQTDNFIISLDIGTQYIKASALSVQDQTLIYGALEDAKGISKVGKIIPEELGEAIKNAINQLELKIQRKISSVFVSMPNEYTRVVPTQGQCYTNNNEVSQRELNETKEGAKRVFHDQNEEVVDLIISKYVLDDTLYNNPCQVTGEKLEIHGQAVLGQKDFIQGLYMAMDKANLKISGLGLASEGAASLLATKKDLRDGVVLVDTGASSTKMIFYRNQKIEDFELVKIGGRNITKDISIVMEKTMVEAEDLKKAYGKGERALNEADGQLLEDVIKARVNEIMGFVEEFIKKQGDSSISKVICHGGGLCGFINIPNLYKTTLKQSTNFMTSDIIRDDTVLHILSGGIAYRLLSSISCEEQKEQFTNLVDETLNGSSVSGEFGTKSQNNLREKYRETAYGTDEEDYESLGEDEVNENKFVTWIKNIINKIKNI